MRKVNNDYYNRNGVEVYDILNLVYQFFGDDLNAKEGFYIGNIIKYLMRYKFKNDPVSDLRKIEVYRLKLEQIEGYEDETY